MAYVFALHLDVLVGLQILSCWTVCPRYKSLKKKVSFASCLQVGTCYDKGPLSGLNEINPCNDIFVLLKYLQSS